MFPEYPIKNDDKFVPTMYFRWYQRRFGKKPPFQFDQTLQQYYVPMGSMYADSPEGEWRNVEIFKDYVGPYWKDEDM